MIDIRRRVTEINEIELIRKCAHYEQQATDKHSRVLSNGRSKWKI